MSYSVEYNPELRKYYPKKREKMPKPPFKLLLIGLVICVGVYVLFSTGFLELFIPGDSQVTVAAFSEMVQNVGAGEQVSDALFGFFRDVVIAGMD